jgi:hypothetical protein
MVKVKPGAKVITIEPSADALSLRCGKYVLGGYATRFFMAGIGNVEGRLEECNGYLDCGCVL